MNLRHLLTSLKHLLLLTAIIWLCFIVNTLLFGGALNRYGIVPREVGGLSGLATAPFLHASWAHLSANTVPLLAIGAAVAVQGKRLFWLATIAVMLLGGLLTWGLARHGTHIGASLLVFGYFGFVLGRAIYSRALLAIAICLVVLPLYSGVIFAGLIPSLGSSTSWEAHLFGFAAGFFAASWVRQRRI